MHAFIAIGVLLATVIVAQSKRWCAPELNRWITQEKVPMSWEDAQRRCERDGAILASPLNPRIFKYMQSLINVHNHSAAYFIGTRAKRSDDGQEVHYVSEEGRRLEDMPKAVYNAIDQLDLEKGDCLSMDRHGIRAVSCWDHLPYICYSNTMTECGLGYTYYAATGSFYKYHDQTKVSWDVANTTCAREGAQLLVINNAEEADVVSRIITPTSYFSSWVGLRDNRPGGVMQWRTLDEEPLSDVYHMWYDGYPVNDAQKTCAEFGARSKRLYNWDCDYMWHFMCEISQ